MVQKSCFKCDKLLPLTSFYKHAQMKDGHLNKCIECTKKDATAVRNASLEYYRGYDRERGMLPHRVAAREKYQKTEQGKKSVCSAREKWEKSNQIKSGAHILVNNAVRSGLLIKPDKCESCNSMKSRLHGHHCDYAKPLEVMWLCPGCHTKWHKHNKPINGD